MDQWRHESSIVFPSDFACFRDVSLDAIFGQLGVNLNQVLLNLRATWLEFGPTSGQFGATWSGLEPTGDQLGRILVQLEANLAQLSPIWRQGGFNLELNNLALGSHWRILG